MHYQSLNSAVMYMCTTSSEYISTSKVVCDIYIYIYIYIVHRASVTDVQMCLCRGRLAQGR
jgi:hypothetical protein